MKLIRISDLSYKKILRKKSELIKRYNRQMSMARALDVLLEVG